MPVPYTVRGCTGNLKRKEPIYCSVPQFPHLQNGDSHSSGYKRKIIGIDDESLQQTKNNTKIPKEMRHSPFFREQLIS